MNRHAYILSVALSCAGANAAYAAIPVQGDPQTPTGGDNLNDNTRSPINWGASSSEGVGMLGIADGRLEYTTTGAPLGTPDRPDFAAWDWNNYSGAVNQSWAFQMDISMPTLGLTNSGQSVLFGVQIPEAAGIFFAVWARRHLGRNWSGEITIKVDHSLVRSGPYRIVRHPIYTAVLGMYAGSALVSGELHALLGLALAAGAYARKVRIEEAVLAGFFGKEYDDYRHATWALVPGLF